MNSVSSNEVSTQLRDARAERASFERTFRQLQTSSQTVPSSRFFRRYKLRVEACEQRQRKFEKRQLDMKDQVTKFEKFIQENDGKRQRADAKARGESKLRDQKASELRRQREDLARLEKERMKQLQQLTRLKASARPRGSRDGVAATPRAPPRIVPRGSRRRRGRELDIPSRQGSRRRRGRGESAETSRGAVDVPSGRGRCDAAAADAESPRRRVAATALTRIETGARRRRRERRPRRRRRDPPDPFSGTASSSNGPWRPRATTPPRRSGTC